VLLFVSECKNKINQNKIKQTKNIVHNRIQSIVCFSFSSDVMSQSVVVPPVHDTSPPPFDDDVDDNDFVPTMSNDDYLQASTPPTAVADVLNNSNDDWKSVDDNNDTDIAQVEQDNEQIETNVENKEDVIVVEEKENDDGWANFASIGNKTDEVLEVNRFQVEI